MHALYFLFVTFISKCWT